ncbi:MAG: hypothetical protein K9G46_05520 [Flavobacteriales bacterium]|jgi:hypothetical protein|nr:hypothetical protein [Flavobacteriales bacterium]
MFKRLFFLSGIIAFLLACALMYFWYLPNHQNENATSIETEAVTSEPDSLHATTPLE